ncbi:MAG: hypothetical protein WCK89_22360 [bacterium]
MPLTGQRLGRVGALGKLARRKQSAVRDAGAAIAAAEGDIRPLLIIVACTGQRLGDICRLEWSSVDLRAGVLTIVPHKTGWRQL